MRELTSKKERSYSLMSSLIGTKFWVKYCIILKDIAQNWSCLGQSTDNYADDIMTFNSCFNISESAFEEEFVNNTFKPGCGKTYHLAHMTYKFGRPILVCMDT